MQDLITPEIAPERRAILDALGDGYRLIKLHGGAEERVLCQRHRKAVYATTRLCARLVRILARNSSELVGDGLEIARRDEADDAHLRRRPSDTPEGVVAAEGADDILGMKTIEGAQDLLDEHQAPVPALEGNNPAEKLDCLRGGRVVGEVLEVLSQSHSAPQEEDGAPRSESYTEAAPGAGDLPADGDPSKASSSELQSRHPDLNRRPADYEFAGDGSPFSPHAQQLAALAWDLVDRDPQLAARVAFDVLELDEHDPAVCVAECCNSPLVLEVRP